MNKTKIKNIASGIEKSCDILRKNDVNIIELITKTVNAPVTGSALFNMKLIFSCEDKDLISRIKKTISSKAKKLNLEIIFAKK